MRKRTWVFAWAWTVGATLITGCSTGGHPQPPQPPEPPPPTPQCSEGQSYSCWHRPPGNEWLYACPVYNSAGQVVGILNVAGGPAQCPKPPTEPPVEPPVPPPSGNYFLDDEALSVVGPASKNTWNKTWEALQQWKAANQDKFRNENCLKAGGAGIDDAYDGIGALLRSKGSDAGQSIDDGGKKSDCIFVNDSGNVYEENHLFEYGGGCYSTSSSSIKNAWRYSGGGTTPPPVQPPPSSGDCPHQPCPIHEWTQATLPPGWDPALVGSPAGLMNCNPHGSGADKDCTPLAQRQEPFCAAIGMSPYADGQPRNDCPMRPDGHPERLDMELWFLYGGWKREGRNGQDCTPAKSESQASILNGTGNCRMCNAKGTMCSPWF